MNNTRECRWVIKKTESILKDFQVIENGNSISIFSPELSDKNLCEKILKDVPLSRLRQTYDKIADEEMENFIIIENSLYFKEFVTADEGKNSERVSICFHSLWFFIFLLCLIQIFTKYNKLVEWNIYEF
jgi:hypothetical protein